MWSSNDSIITTGSWLEPTVILSLPVWDKTRPTVIDCMKNIITFSYYVWVRRTLYQSCSTRQDQQLCYWQHFHLKSFWCWIFDSQDCIELIPKESICSIVICVVVEKDLRWTNHQNKSCRSQKVIQLCSSDLFYLKSFWCWNIWFTRFYRVNT